MADLMRGARNKIVDDIMSEKVDIDLTEDKGAQSWEGGGGYSYEILSPGQIKVTGSSDSNTLKGGKSVVVTDPSMVRNIMSERDMTNVMETERTPGPREALISDMKSTTESLRPERTSVKMTDPGDKSPGPSAAALRKMMQGASMEVGEQATEGAMEGMQPPSIAMETEEEFNRRLDKQYPDAPEQGLIGEASSYLSGLMAKAQEAGDVASFQKISKLVAQMMKGQ